MKAPYRLRFRTRVVRSWFLRIGLFLSQRDVPSVTGGGISAFDRARETLFLARLAHENASDRATAWLLIRRGVELALESVLVNANATGAELAARSKRVLEVRGLGGPELDRLWAELPATLTDGGEERNDAALENALAVAALVGRFHRSTPSGKRRFARALIGRAVLALLLIATAKLGMVAYDRFRAHGLTAQYFADTEFRALVLTRVDPTVDFSWGFYPVGPGVPTQKFSARWTGRLRVPARGTYRFSLRSNEGAHLYIDHKLVIDNWASHSMDPPMGCTLELDEGYVSIGVEYMGEARGAAIGLYWAAASEPLTVIDPSYLYPA